MLFAVVAELAYAHDSGSCPLTRVWVQVPSTAFSLLYVIWVLCGAKHSLNVIFCLYSRIASQFARYKNGTSCLSRYGDLTPHLNIIFVYTRELLRNLLVIKTALRASQGTGI